WWLPGRARQEMRAFLKGIESFIATVQTSKHVIFSTLSTSILPDDKLVSIGLENSSILGVLSSRVHSSWALASGSRLGVGNDPVYNKSTCFDAFPFPALTEPQKIIVGDLAEKIDQLRKQQQAQHTKLTLTDIYNVLEKLRKDEVLDKKEQLINKQGLVSILRELHDELDRQVFAAYGWHDLADALVGKAGATTPLPGKSDDQAQAEEELLSRLVALNHQRTAEEKSGKVRWLRPDYQNPDTEVEEKQEQVDMDLADISTKQKVTAPKTTTKATWPKVLSEQIAAVIELLADPATCEQIADNFKRKPIKQVQPVLEALEALGRARLSGDAWELN
ncbi:MAG: class I SAM-dependent DNA methyltransferase, partial [Pseudomonadota bacterium]